MATKKHRKDKQSEGVYVRFTPRERQALIKAETIHASKAAELVRTQILYWLTYNKYL